MKDEERAAIRSDTVSSINSVLLYHLASRILTAQEIDSIVFHTIRQCRQNMVGKHDSKELFHEIDKASEDIQKIISSIFDAKNTSDDIEDTGDRDEEMH